MNKLTIKLDYWLNDELEKYLMQLNGVIKVVIDKEQDIIDVVYNLEIISIYIIIKEIKLFLDMDKTPLVMSFDKHSDNNLVEYDVNIKDLCCEYCLYGNIEELLMIDGIMSAVSDYDNVNKENVKIRLCYDNNLISVDEIIQLETKFNNI